MRIKFANFIFINPQINIKYFKNTFKMVKIFLFKSIASSSLLLCNQQLIFLYLIYN